MTERTAARARLTRPRRAFAVVAVVGILVACVAAGAAAAETPTPGGPAPATATPTPSATVEPTPTTDPTQTATPEPVVSPTPTASASPSPTATAPVVPVPTSTPTGRPAPAIPPAITTSTIGIETMLIAAGVLIAGAVLLWALMRRRSAPRTDAAAFAPTLKPAPFVLDSMAALGATMIDCGYPVGLVRSTLEDMARANGVEAQVVVFPTSILASTDDGVSAQTRVVAAGETPALLHQVDAVDRLAGIARSRRGSAALVRSQLARIRALPAPFARWQRILAYGVMSAALSVLLGSSWLGVALAAVLGLGVGTVLLAAEQMAAVHRALVVVAVSLCVAIAVLVVARVLDPGVLPALVAPLVMLLPGGLLTIGVIELATGDIMSGAARVASGAIRLLLLSTGIVAAGALVGVPVASTAEWPLGPIIPWLAVAVFGVGIGVHQCARPGSIGWILVVLYVAYGAQVIGDLFFNGVLSALVGAAAMTPVAVIVARQRTGPPALVSFLPAFWLLVPGALGLIGVASLLEGDSSGLGTVVTTIATMVSISLGVLLGLAATGSARGFRNAPAEDWMQEEFGPEATRGRTDADGMDSAAQ